MTLKERTSEFFRRHWPETTRFQQTCHPPNWIGGWKWQGSVPYHDKSGVYALISRTGEVIYVGLGASRGSGQYLQHGLSRRITAHVIMQDKKRGRGFYLPRPKWVEVDSIATIGMPDHLSYLSPALEDFLISEIRPEKNIAKCPRTARLAPSNSSSQDQSQS